MECGIESIYPIFILVRPEEPQYLNPILEAVLMWELSLFGSEMNSSFIKMHEQSVKNPPTLI